MLTRQEHERLKQQLFVNDDVPSSIGTLSSDDYAILDETKEPNDDSFFEGGADPSSTPSPMKGASADRERGESSVRRGKTFKKGPQVESEKKRRVALYGQKATSKIFEQAAKNVHWAGFNLSGNNQSGEDNQQKNQETCKERIIIAYDNKNKAIFDVVILFFVLYSCVTSTFYVAYAQIDNAFLSFFDEFIEILFWCDLALNFLHSYRDPDTFKAVTDLKAIAQNYVFRGWFFIDFISVFPFKNLLQGGGAGEITKLLRLFRLPRLAKLFDIQRFKKLVQSLMAGGGESREENITMQYVMLYVFKIFRLIILAMIITYFIGCLWWYLCSLKVGEAEGSNNFINYYGLGGENGATEM